MLHENVVMDYLREWKLQNTVMIHGDGHDKYDTEYPM
jgi:hypothetical protein